MARVVRTEQQQRGCFGMGVLILFWLFNGLMVWWLFSYYAQVGNMTAGLSSDAEKAGAAIGLGIGTTMVFVIWGAGAVILGLMVLLTRGKTVIVEETAGGQPGPAPMIDVDTSKWPRRDRDRYLAQQIAPPAPAIEPVPFGWRLHEGVSKPFSRAQYDAYSTAMREQLATWEATVRRLERNAGRDPDAIAEADTLLAEIDKGAARYAAFHRGLTLTTGRPEDLTAEFDHLAERLTALLESAKGD